MTDCFINIRVNEHEEAKVEILHDRVARVWSPFILDSGEIIWQDAIVLLKYRTGEGDALPEIDEVLWQPYEWALDFAIRPARESYDLLRGLLILLGGDCYFYLDPDKKEDTVLVARNRWFDIKGFLKSLDLFEILH
jgi:hypothetical protein